MDLYLIRHAEAAPLTDGGTAEDANRPLTSRGQEQARTTAAGLLKRGIRPKVVVTSPLLRARQTAEELLSQYGQAAPELRVCDELAPGGKRRKLSRFLKTLGTDAVALVGHRPDLDDFAAWLIGSRNADLNIAKAGVAYVACAADLEKGSGTLNWLVPPEWLQEEATPRDPASVSAQT